MMNTARHVTIGAVLGLLSTGAEGTGGGEKNMGAWEGRGLLCRGKERSERQEEVVVCMGQA